MKALKQKQTMLKEYGQRLGKIDEEHNAYYYNVIIPNFEAMRAREEALRKREEALEEKEREWRATLASYEAWIAQAEAYIRYLQDTKTTVKKLMPPMPKKIQAVRR